MNNYDKSEKACLEAHIGINIKENEKIVLECKTFWSYFFAREIKEVDIKAHEKVILELKSPEYCYWFARDILSANVEEHFKVIFNSGNKYYLDRFIKEVNYKNTKVEEWLLYI